jgi:hypothetical protein
LARIDNDASIYYYHVDHLGTPQAMTNSTGATVWKADYEPFGKATVKVNTVENNLRLPGQYYDRETGCITTTSGITIRRPEGTSRRIRLGWRGG